MTRIPIKEAKDRLTELARRVEAGETITVTRNGRPVVDIVPHQKRRTLDLEAVERFKTRHKLKSIVARISDDFDAPLAEDFLFRPLPRKR